MSMKTTSKAAKKNPALDAYSVLVGTWKTEGSHPLLPGVTLKGQVTFEWLDKGAFLMMRNHIDHKDFPDGIAMIGSDDSYKEHSMIYFDERNVSRIYTSTIKGKTWKYWRKDKKFSQKFTCEIKDDGKTIVSKGKMSEKGKAWKKDLQLVYTKT